MKLPTAMQNLGETQETPFRELFRAWGIKGTRAADHLEPLSRSANGVCMPEPFVDCPTAIQTVFNPHDRPKNVLDRAPGGVRERKNDQPPAFQRAAKPRTPTVPLAEPATMQVRRASHEIAKSFAVGALGAV
ncbi:MAG: hypothetical protein ACXVHJ_01640 [Solirubrobacteraceae bacterium]